MMRRHAIDTPPSNIGEGGIKQDSGGLSGSGTPKLAPSETSDRNGNNGKPLSNWMVAISLAKSSGSDQCEAKSGSASRGLGTIIQ